MTNLVIVESKTKEKTISKYLNSIPEFKDRGKFHVIASLGHIQDLPLKTMGVDLTTWEAEYVTQPTKEKIISKLKSAVREAKVVYLASDEDTEGEAIAFHLQNVLRLKKASTHRITFSEITKDALKRAILNPRSINMNRVAAQESRRILDRVVGYELSPLLWRRFTASKLSAGRVQSCVLKMAVDRAKEITEHEPELYWTVDGTFQSPKGIELIAKAYQEGETQTWEVEKEIQEWLQYLAKRVKKDVWTATFKEGQAKKNPPPPFTTSTLQQEAYTRLGLPSKRTMQLAQGLYEAGLITYMRTDSVAIAEEAQQKILNYVTDTYGAAMAQARKYKTKAKNAQEAHECVRVTDPRQTSLPSEEDMTPSHKRLYELIWKRTIATQMAPAVYTEVMYTISSKCCEPIEFRGKTSFLVEEGYLKVYGYDREEKKEGKLEQWKSLLQLGKLEVSPTTFMAEGDVTRPPSLYTEPTIVKAMEKEGIGRPSTYATIVDKLFEKGYVMKGPNPSQVIPVKSFTLTVPKTTLEETERSVKLGGNEMDRIVPTSLGERVVEYLEPIVPFILDSKFTSNLEEELDTVMMGKNTKNKVLDTFYKKFHPEVERALEQQKEISKQKKKEAPAKGEKEDDVPKGPKNILKDFPKVGVQLVQTRFGPALYRETDQKFVSVNPYLEWQKMTYEELTDKEVKGLYALPWTVPDTNRQVMMGKFGLYLKDGKDNLRMPRELWQKAFDRKLVAHDISGIKAYKKK